EYMVQDFSVVPPSTDLYAVMEIILGKRQRIVPVEEDGAIIGVITRTDLVNLLIEEPARIPESLMPERSRDRNIRSLMRNRLPRPMYDLLVSAGTLAQDEGAVAYAVGGFVRDILLGRKNLDLDLVIEGDGVAFARKLAERVGGRVKEHHKFKTAVVIFPDDSRVDVATARLEYYEHPAALPTVELSSIKMDLYRRDFTVNALAVNLNPGSFGQLADFFGAQADIRDRVIRVLHSLSFVEDPTRILRAVRFEQRFGFQIGGQTLKLIKNALQLNLMTRLSGSRLFHELNMIMEEEHPLDSLRRLDELGVLPAIHPLLRLDDKREAIIEELDRVQGWYRLLFLDPAPVRWKLYFLGLCMGVKREEIQTILTRLGLTQREERDFLALRDAIAEALSSLMGWDEKTSPLSRLYFTLDPLPVEGVLFLMAKSRKEQVRKHISQFLANVRFKRLDIGGRDLKKLGLPPGPLYARILRHVRTRFIDGFAPDRESQLSLARQLIRYPELLDRGA
ncbi:MAG: CBS domain-containing protein, partial [Desulfovibrionaceae bacterium]